MGNVTGVFNFEPADGSTEGPYGDIVYLTEGPEGALYYVDILGWNGTTARRRQQDPPHQLREFQPAARSFGLRDADGGPTPAHCHFLERRLIRSRRSAAQLFMEFRRRNRTSTAANPTHTYNTAGPYQARLTVSDGVNSTLSTPLSISVGNRPVITSLYYHSFRWWIVQGGRCDLLQRNGDGRRRRPLPASAYTWEIDFLHEGHVHPGAPLTGVTSGTFTIPTSGHDFSGNTRYRITLTVTDTDGLQSSQSATVYPEKVNLTFDTTPAWADIVLGRHRTHGAVRLRHADRLQPHHRSAQSDHRRKYVQLRLMVRWRHAAAYDRRAGCTANLHGDLQCRLHAGPDSLLCK